SRGYTYSPQPLPRRAQGRSQRPSQPRLIPLNANSPELCGDHVRRLAARRARARADRREARGAMTEADGQQALRERLEAAIERRMDAASGMLDALPASDKLDRERAVARLRAAFERIQEA